MESVRLEPELIRQYDVNGPRYTSYPTANRFIEGDFQSDYAHAFAGLPADAPLSLYVHVPFCATICYYCACNKINTGNHKLANEYIERLITEMALHAEFAPANHTVEQLHFGGGTPTFLDDAQLTHVIESLSNTFNLSQSEQRDYSIEIDPRKLPPARVETLASLGFNRMSIGVQDFDPVVQEAVNRIQTEEETGNIVERARANGFGSISFDLIYGLPRQTLQGFRRTLARVVRLAPDRLSIYSYAHLPQRFKTQRQIKATDLPDAAVKLELLQTAIDFLTESGYVYVGMDHFAKPTDSLFVAQREDRLQRNFQGYSTHRDCALIGLGVSAIGSVGPVYCQNAKTLSDYNTAIDDHRFAFERGYVLSAQDAMIREVIQSLMCSFALDLGAFEDRYQIDFKTCFADTLPALAEMAEQGLVAVTPDRIEVTAMGRFVIRNLCMLFDAHLEPGTSGFSKAI